MDMIPWIFVKNECNDWLLVAQMAHPRLVSGRRFVVMSYCYALGLRIVCLVASCCVLHAAAFSFLPNGIIRFFRSAFGFDLDQS